MVDLWPYWDTLSLKEDLIASATHDWQHISDVVGIARRSGLVDDDLLRMFIVGLIGQVLVEGLMVAGDAMDGFSAWPMSVGESIARIARELGETPIDELAPGNIAWFALTQEGELLGKRLIRSLEEKAGS